MTRNVQQKSVAVVPDSGTGQLVGLSGNMDVVIENGKHSYKFTLLSQPRGNSMTLTK